MRALTLLPLIVLTTGCSVFGVNYNTEEPSYRVLEADNDFEVRLYDSMVLAATTVNGSFDSAGNRAFGALFGYISGENVTNSKIAMTAPVIADQAGAAEGRKIPMTAPVLRESNDQGWRYLFVLPEEFSLENAPAPLNEQVKLTAEPAKKIAVLRYSGSMDEQKLEQKVSQLQQWIADNQLVAVSQPRWAGYNPPWTLPFLRRNEVMIEVN